LRITVSFVLMVPPGCGAAGGTVYAATGMTVSVKAGDLPSRPVAETTRRAEPLS
jgi:hypothetical protein